MKNIIYCIVISLLYTNLLCGQGDFSLAVNTGLSINHYDLGVDFIEPYSTDNIQDRMNIGYSFHLNAELPISQQQSLIFGISGLRINNYPNVDYGLWYGLVIQKDNGEQVYIGPSYLERLQFDLIELPLSWRYYFRKQAKVNPYLGLGLTTSFSWRERERWKSLFDQGEFSNIDGEHFYEYQATSQEFRHFRSALTLDIGSTLWLNNRFSLVVDIQSNILEHRQQQTSMVTDWVPEYWGVEVAYLSQFSMSVGLRRKF